ncbi:MAG: hypothetical protein PCFJNLEI_00955 [Verrucomicrobiae bacterium]|nr:hypothetical protein [Verrucomicrobiae bacterium]
MNMRPLYCLASLLAFSVTAAETLTVSRLEDRADGSKALRFRSDTGLFQMSIFFDAAQFDWESLYRNLTEFNNNNQRTGPWDFDLKTVTPLVPAYWITLDGQKLGLWYAQRPSLEDIANKRFRGRFAFAVNQAGDHLLEFKPYRPFTVTWLSTRLETDPEDQLATNLTPLRPPTSLPAAAFADPAFWKAQRQKLDTTHTLYQKPLQHILTGPLRGSGWDGWPLQVAGYHWNPTNTNALKHLRASVDGVIARPAWGRLQEDAYGYNGDIGGGSILRNMAFAYHMLGDELGAERRALLLKKLALQGDAFLTQTLLMRDYWGGSLLQDHGWRALFDFGTAAMHLWGVIPEADRWVAYVIPRLRRALAAAPPEGNIPGSSYYSIWLYGQNVMWYRDALLARTGEDILEQPALRRLPAFLAAVYDENRRAIYVVENGDKIRVFGSQHLLAAVAAKFRDPVAARLHRLLVESALDPEAHGNHQGEENIATFWGFLTYDPTVPEAPAPSQPVRQLIWYKDAGFVQYRNDEQDVALALRCGPWLGYHSQLLATGPCDMMECRPGMGHFALFVNGEPILMSPDLGYRLDSRTSSILLVDDHGQIGDAGYPMSIPSQPHSGAQVESVRWDPRKNTGVIRLDLKRAYPAALGVTHYTREFHVAPARRVICRDYVVLSKPRRLSWLFQFQKETGGEIEKTGAARVGPLRIIPQPAGFAVTGQIAPSPVVFSYSSKFNKFDHVRFETSAPVESATIDFEMEW